jgi:hypothetical protein
MDTIWDIGVRALRKFGMLDGIGVVGDGCLVSISTNSMKALFVSMQNAGSPLTAFVDMGCGSGAVVLMAVLFGWQAGVGIDIRDIPVGTAESVLAYIIAAAHGNVPTVEHTKLRKRLSKFVLHPNVDAGNTRTVLPLIPLGADVYAWFTSWTPHDAAAAVRACVKCNCVAVGGGTRPLGPLKIQALLGPKWTVRECSKVVRAYAIGSSYQLRIFSRY